MSRVSALGLAVCLFGAPATMEQQPAPATVPAQAFVDLLVKQDFAAATGMFNANMLKAMPEEKLRQFWASVGAQAGAFRSREMADVQVRGVHTAVILRTTFARMTADITVVVDAGGKVAGLFLRPVPPPSPPRRLSSWDRAR